MAWFSTNNTWRSFPDLAGAVNKLQESVKNIEKNFDSALGLEENSESSNEASGSWTLRRDPKALFNPVMAFMGNNGEENTDEKSEQLESPQQESEPKKSLDKPVSPDDVPVAEKKETTVAEEKEGFQNDSAAVVTTEETIVAEKKEGLQDENAALVTTEETLGEKKEGFQEEGFQEDNAAIVTTEETAVSKKKEGFQNDNAALDTAEETTGVEKETTVAEEKEGLENDKAAVVTTEETTDKKKDTTIDEKAEGFENDSTAVVNTEETDVQEVNEAEKVEEEGGEQMESADENTTHATADETTVLEKNEVLKVEVEDGEQKELADGTTIQNLDHGSEEHQLPEMPVDLSELNIQHAKSLDPDPVVINQENEIAEARTTESLLSMQPMPVNLGEDQVEGSMSDPGESQGLSDVQQKNQMEANEESKEERVQAEESVERVSSIQPEISGDSDKKDKADTSVPHAMAVEEDDAARHSHIEILSSFSPSNESSEVVSESSLHENEATHEAKEVYHKVNDVKTDTREQHLQSVTNISVSDSMLEVERLKRDMKMMEAALQGAARQAQAKADEIAKLMNENEHLKGMIQDLKKKSNDAEMEHLREEYHQKVGTLERKVYALTKERDTLRREQNKRSDAAALLKEKDEIITQVMAEGEELSRKQAIQESTIRKLRAQIRELEEEKKGLATKLQAEENKVESIKRDKMATENLLQETMEKHQAELATQKEYYSNALAAAKEAEALAEARANNEARTELENRLREAEDRESALVQALEELRQTLTRKDQQAIFKEDMLRKDIEDLKKRYQASERRCEELIMQVPESTRPLLRQIEAMQEANSRKADAWAAVERNLSSRLEEAEAKAAAAEERERSVNERLSQTLSRINVLDAQISCLRAEQTQLNRTLEKERQRAAESRQEYLASKEDADTQEGRVRRLELEIRELRQKHKKELQDALVEREYLQQEIEKEKAARLDLERTSRLHSAQLSDQRMTTKQNSAFENVSRSSSLASMGESYFLQASLDSSGSFSERRNSGEGMSPYYMRSMTPSAFESALRQKENELASYMSRLASMESIRDSLSEELVKMTEQCEKLRAEASMLPSVRAELDALRRRHSAALELMGERDEELEELRADIVDLKEMYREQVNLLVSKIQRMSS
ncbi:golgin candidate 5-like isoform X2 [Arachis stenosperma]|uniref:golgin candidate 5-like isoform X2 n=1 Tax=Arachis stenosperma TaxID=217475 RepID=UPI0025AC02E2|nr:golgin candidate 5-like isoform X2 [Arachis stenosperma]